MVLSLISALKELKKNLSELLNVKSSSGVQCDPSEMS